MVVEKKLKIVPKIFADFNVPPPYIYSRDMPTLGKLALPFVRAQIIGRLELSKSRNQADPKLLTDDTSKKKKKFNKFKIEWLAVVTYI